MIREALRGVARYLLGVWVVEIDGVHVATCNTEIDANRAADELATVADGRRVTIRWIWPGR